MKLLVMSPGIRSVMLAIICGMMAAAFLHDRGFVDLGFGFSQGGMEEGALMALIGGLGGYGILLLFRTIRRFAKRAGTP